MPKHTPFYDFHVAQGGRMVDFAGWEMPIAYPAGILAEHHQTRTSGSIFDVSHMGRLHFTGKDAQSFLNRVLTRNISDQRVGQSRYSLVCNEAGGILDDIIVSRDTKNWIVVCNASNRDKLVKYFTEQRTAWSSDFDLADQTESTAMVALQGPKIIDKLAAILPIDLKALKRYHFETASLMLVKFTVFRSGYTGEDGVELVLPAKMASLAIKALAGQLDKPDATIKPAGLGARDTLRLEAAMPLYGHELSESIDPLSANLSWAVDLSKDFVGAERLRAIHTAGPTQKLVGLELQSKRIARQGATVLSGTTPVGTVTSGTLSPTLQKSIALAYIQTPHLADSLTIDFSGTPTPVQIVKTPFYKRTN